MDFCNIYGDSIIYGSGLIYADWCQVVCYDFGIDIYDSNTSLPVSGFYWSLYRRDPNISPHDIIDETHTLVDSGQSLQGMLQINLDDYSLKLIDTDYLITASLESSAASASDITRVYVKYYHTDYVRSEQNCPYLYNKIGVQKGTCVGHGRIEVEPNRWQLISIPIQYGYWDDTQHKLVHDNTTIARIHNYVVKQIEDVYGVPCNTMIEVFNTYFGDPNKYYNFIPGVTDPLSIHNFELAYQDGPNLEYTGFWVKSIHDTSFFIEWGEP
jgi:hypothetical protein